MRLHNYTPVALLTALLFAVPASQAKGPPEGKGTAQMPGLNMGSDAEELAKEKAEKAEELKEQKMKQEKNKLKKVEKQKEKKAEQVQKEAGKGSEKGQAMREEHRRKWWKFWGGGETDGETATE